MNPLIPKTAQGKTITFPIVDLLGLRTTKGDVGLEIEVEGNKFPKHAYEGYDPVDPHLIPKAWVYHRDGSLRGQDNAEYVFKKPLSFNDVQKEVEGLWTMFKDYGTVLDDSNRTSVHVHLNAQNFYLNRLCAFMCLYFSVEELLTAWCGEHRVGNLFCLRAKDAPGIITELKKFFQHNGRYHFSSGMHYAGLNASSLERFGSVEVRTLRGCKDPQEIIQWVQILQRLYELSEEFLDPRQVIEGFSGEGYMGYLERVLGPHMSNVMNNVKMSYTEIRDSLYEGIRLAQDLSYCLPWENMDYTVITPDPFGRKTTKKTLGQILGTAPPPPQALQLFATVGGATISVTDDEYVSEPEEYYDYDED